jgi:RNA-binding protein
MTPLTGKQKQFLKGLAHPLSPIIRVGKGGVSQALIEETKKTLEVHELIKVRIDVEDSTDRRGMAETLAHATDAQIAGAIGKIAILYRAREENPEIELPA